MYILYQSNLQNMSNLLWITKHKYIKLIKKYEIFLTPSASCSALKKVPSRSLAYFGGDAFQVLVFLIDSQNRRSHSSTVSSCGVNRRSSFRVAFSCRGVCIPSVTSSGMICKYKYFRHLVFSIHEVDKYKVDVILF